ncbi:MAG: PatB family C-S lyase [Erysipelotrichaceae bacterium]
MYNFDERIMQKGTTDEKHDQLLEFFPRDDLLPMWVAEMDFQSAPSVNEALLKRVKHGIYGYTYRSDSYYQAIIDWYKEEHDSVITKEMLSFDTGVVKAVFEMIRIFSKEGDGVLVPMPAYPQFSKAIALSKRKLVKFDLTNHNNRYYFDFDALKQALSSCKLFILCSPHNPGGRVWSKEELSKIVQICDETNTILISDEIHCDLTMNHQKFTSLISISEHAIVINSASKSFNLAGLQHSYNLCRDVEMQKKIEEHYFNNKIKSTNLLSMTALEGAYLGGRDWLHELRDYLYENYNIVNNFVKEHHLNIPVFELEAGYLMWLDFSAYFSEASELEDFLVNTCHIATTFGSNFDEKCGCFTRLNVGTQHFICVEAMNRILLGLKERGKI